ncbi:unnamed protein product [Rhizoctonia solani]|uniref:Uncharacterized protein n=1 Tax=Rhizoctonia solani TaxID=456999 RepID=A0A8H3CHD6_9AGAM|nr:unnamed protein product [Rhizoctonia solani]CAE6483729.1 unnamed protein product [Rhizoctonia solani]
MIKFLLLSLLPVVLADIWGFTPDEPVGTSPNDTACVRVGSRVVPWAGDAVPVGRVAAPDTTVSLADAVPTGELVLEVCGDARSQERSLARMKTSVVPLVRRAIAIQTARRDVETVEATQTLRPEPRARQFEPPQPRLQLQL